MYTSIFVAPINQSHLKISGLLSLKDREFKYEIDNVHEGC